MIPKIQTRMKNGDSIFQQKQYYLHMKTEELTNNVLKALDEIRPFLNSDGGDITLISIDEGKHVKVRLEGACTSCSVNQMTLRAGVETTIKKYAPQIETVVNVL
jgi:Fe-S cluster biogenesis protein NfuA